MVLLDSERLDRALERAAATRPEPTPRPSFAEVYDDHLDAVWRFLRSRVGDPHVAEDLTSEVFVRAWRSWDRFDHTRGRVEPWLWTIAHRTLVDHWRRVRPEPIDPGEQDLLVELDRLPEDEALREDLLLRLGAALQRLQPRERDALAMRFAARLPVDDVANVLGLGTSATKMLLHRAIDRLRGEVVDVAAVELAGPADLEAVIDDILERGSPAMADGELASLLVHLAVVHDAPTPPTLHDEVADCVRCEVRSRLEAAARRDDDEPDADGPPPAAGPARPHQRRPLRAHAAGWAFALLLFVPVCLACTVSIMSLVVGSALGAASVAVHELTLLTTPVILWLLARAQRRHGGTLGFRIAVAGAGVLALHTGFHAAFYVLEDGWRVLGELAWAEPTFTWTNRLGTALLVLGTATSWQQGRAWRRREAELFAALAHHRARRIPATGLTA